MSDSVLRLTLANIDKGIQALEEEVLKGTPKDWAEYRYRVGEIQGLLRAKRELLDALKTIEVS